MTSSYTGNTGQNDQSVAVTGATSTKPAPKFFNPTPIAFEITNNEYTSAPYYFDYTRNSWIFYKPGTFVPMPPPDPDAGNLFIAANNMYLMYVYNTNELTFPDAMEDRWYALTTNKRAYDYMIVPISRDGSDIETYRNRDSGLDVFKQGYLYFNLNEGDIKVKVLNDAGAETEWASITQRGMDPVSGANPNDLWNGALPASALRQLQTSTNGLQSRVEALAAKLGYVMSVSTSDGTGSAPTGTGTNTYPAPTSTTNPYSTEDSGTSASGGY